MKLDDSLMPLLPPPLPGLSKGQLTSSNLGVTVGLASLVLRQLDQG